MIIEKHSNEYFHCRIPGIVCTRNGSLIAYYECRKSDSDWSEIDIKIIKSTDNGKTWNTVRLINGNGKTLNNPVIICGDKLHLLYCVNYREVFHCVSVDDGESWSDSEEITHVFDNIDHTVVATGPGHGIATADGTLLIPLWFANNKENKLAHAPSFISTLFSSDGGKNWHVGEIINTETLINPSECALGLLSDGSVLISIRNENFQKLRCFAKSKNGYSNWYNTGLDERFNDPICQGSITNYENRIFHINCDDKNTRKNLTLKISDDDFRTFEKIRVDASGGYSDICIKDGVAYIIYEDTTDKDGEYFVDLKLKTII